VLAALDAARIAIASGTYEIVGMPELKVQVQPVGGSVAVADRAVAR
jgi:hypothetical protein